MSLQAYPIITRIQNNNGIQQAEVYWSVDTSAGFTALPMTPMANDSFVAEIPRQAGYDKIFYYISAQSNSGKVVTRPLTAPQGFYTLQIEAVTSLEEKPAVLSQRPVLYPNFPNPFNPTTTIRWQLPMAGKVKLSIYNSAGQKISQLIDEDQTAGEHKVEFDGAALASGVYFYWLTVEYGATKTVNFTETQKMLFIK